MHFQCTVCDATDYYFYFAVFSQTWCNVDTQNSALHKDFKEFIEKNILRKGPNPGKLLNLNYSIPLPTYSDYPLRCSMLDGVT